jgi:hypothetical protein
LAAAKKKSYKKVTFGKGQKGTSKYSIWPHLSKKIVQEKQAEGTTYSWILTLKLNVLGC